MLRNKVENKQKDIILLADGEVITDVTSTLSDWDGALTPGQKPQESQEHCPRNTRRNTKFSVFFVFLRVFRG